MSERGYFFLERSIWDHPGFAREAFTEREAWLWMISSAAWKATKVRANRKVVSLDRGQLVFSERFLAEKWRWSKTSVRRFIERLKSEEMVSTLADRDATRITICNYDKYQLGGTTRGPQTGPLADHSRTKEEEDNNLRTKNSSGGAVAPDAEKKSRKKPVRAMPDIFPMSEAQKTYAEKCGYKFEIGPCFAYNKTRPGPAQAMFTAFKNHHAAKGSMFADWDAAWRTWVDNQVKWDTERGKSPGLRPAI